MAHEIEPYNDLLFACIRSHFSRVLLEEELELASELREGQGVAEVEAEGLQERVQLAEGEEALLACILDEPVAEGSKLIAVELLAERALIGRYDLVPVDLKELLKVEDTSWEVTEVAEVRVDHLLHVLGVERHPELELLSEIMMEVDEVLALDAMKLAVLETIEVLPEQGQILVLDAVVRVRQCLLAGLEIAGPEVKLLLGHLLSGSNFLGFGEFSSERKQLAHEHAVLRVVVVLRLARELLNLDLDWLGLGDQRRHLEVGLLQSDCLGRAIEFLVELVEGLLGSPQDLLLHLGPHI